MQVLVNKNMDAEVVMNNDTTIKELKEMKPVNRTYKILEIRVLESLTAEDDGVNLNEGYEYEVNGSMPQLADGLAKMFIEMDKDKDFGERAGGALLTLLTEYYNRLLTE